MPILHRIANTLSAAFAIALVLSFVQQTAPALLPSVTEHVPAVGGVYTVLKALGPQTLCQ